MAACLYITGILGLCSARLFQVPNLQRPVRTASPNFFVSKCIFHFSSFFLFLLVWHSMGKDFKPVHLQFLNF